MTIDRVAIRTLPALPPPPPPPYKRRPARIVVGAVRTVLSAVLGLMCVLGARTASAAVELVLPIYVGENATTAPILVNPTSHEINFPDSQVCDPFGCRTVPGIRVGPGLTVILSSVTPNKPGAVAGLYRIASPDPELIVYSEIVTGAHALFRVYPLVASNVAHYYDVQHSGPFNGFVFVGADGPLVFTGPDGHQINLTRDDAVILPAPALGYFDVVSQLGASKLYTFAGINSQSNGSLQIIHAR